MSHRSPLIPVLAAALLGATVPAAAHHSFAAIFDAAKPVKITGTVTRMEWMNPHTWIYIDAKAADGKAEQWAFELGSPNRLMRYGWNQDSLPAGTTVTITGTDFYNVAAVTFGSANATNCRSPAGGLTPPGQPGTSPGTSGRPMSRRIDSRFCWISAPIDSQRR